LQSVDRSQKSLRRASEQCFGPRFGGRSQWNCGVKVVFALLPNSLLEGVLQTRIFALSTVVGVGCRRSCNPLLGGLHGPTEPNHGAGSCGEGISAATGSNVCCTPGLRQAALDHLAVDGVRLFEGVARGRAYLLPADEQLVESRVRSSLPRNLCGFRSSQPALPGSHALFGGFGRQQAHSYEDDKARQHTPNDGGVREQPI
jgi:hypothetical protein